MPAVLRCSAFGTRRRSARLTCCRSDAETEPLAEVTVVPVATSNRTSRVVAGLSSKNPALAVEVIDAATKIAIARKVGPNIGLTLW